MHLKTDKVDLKKKTPWKKKNLQVDMKNVVECYKQFFGYFNTLETNSDIAQEN